MEIFDEKYYLNLEGGILEALGRMFKSGLKLYVYPMIDEKTGELVTATKLEVAPNLRSLFRYLIENEFIQEITDYQSAIICAFIRRKCSRNCNRATRPGKRWFRRKWRKSSKSAQVLRLSRRPRPE